MIYTCECPLSDYTPKTFKTYVPGIVASRRLKFVLLYVAAYMYTSNPLKYQF